MGPPAGGPRPDETIREPQRGPAGQEVLGAGAEGTPSLPPAAAGAWRAARSPLLGTLPDSPVFLSSLVKEASQSHLIPGSTAVGEASYPLTLGRVLGRAPCGRREAFPS